jgi:hypothetical protein
MTRIINTSLDVPTLRDIVKRNGPISHVIIKISTEEKWLPQILTNLNFFSSNSEVKKNRKDLWREINGDCFIEFPWALVLITFNETMR